MPIFDKLSHYYPSLIATSLIVAPFIYLKLKYSFASAQQSFTSKFLWRGTAILLILGLLSGSALLSTQHSRCQSYCHNQAYESAELEFVSRYTVLEGVCTCYNPSNATKIEIPFRFGYPVP